MATFPDLPEASRLAINRMAIHTDKEKQLLNKAIDRATAAAKAYADTAIAASGHLSNVVEDTTPQLGGNLDVNGNSIVSTANGNITLTPNGTGNIVLGSFTLDADQSVGAGQDNYVLTYDHSSGTISLEAASGGGGGLSDVVDDTTPQLGGSLDVNGQKIVSVSNGNIDIEPNGTGNVLLGNFTFDADQTVGAGQDNYVLTYDNATGLISLEASAGGGGGLNDVVDDTTPQLGGNLDVNGQSIVSVSAGNITITPDTTGSIVLDGLSWPQSDGTSGQALTTDGAGNLSFSTVGSGSSPATGYGEIRVEGNASATTISSSSTDFTNKVQVTIFDTNGESSSAVTPDHTNDHITVANAGDYLVTAAISFSGSANDVVSFGLFKNNGATQLGSRSTGILDASGNVNVVLVSAVADLSASDTVELWVQNETDTDDITVQDASLAVVGVTGLTELLDDTSPQLGGNLDVNGYKIVSTANGDIDIEPNGTGNVLLGNYVFDVDQSVGAGQDNYVLTYDNSDGEISLEAPSFINASDTPSSYSGQANKYLAVNAGANAVEFVSGPVESVSATSPLQKSGTTNVTLSIPAAAAPSTNGYMTGADKSKLDNLEANADVTDATNVAAAGAVMDSDFSADGLLERSGGSGSYTTRGITISSSAPSGGSNGDLWYQI